MQHHEYDSADFTFYHNKHMLFNENEMLVNYYIETVHDLHVMKTTNIKQDKQIYGQFKNL